VYTHFGHKVSGLTGEVRHFSRINVQLKTSFTEVGIQFHDFNRLANGPWGGLIRGLEEPSPDS
jgi:hypothetical protein